MPLIEIVSNRTDLDVPIPIRRVPATIESIGLKRPHISTIYRLIKQGRLRTLQAFGHRYTTLRAIVDSCDGNFSEHLTRSDQADRSNDFLDQEGA